MLLILVGSAEFKAAEVVEAFVEYSEEDLVYDKRCDLRSLGVMTYILLCGQMCGWNEGGCCEECQRRLFDNRKVWTFYCLNIYQYKEVFMKDGHFVFPSRDWAHISEDAKNFITKLLVKDAKQGMSASELVMHPWLENNNNSMLQTPARLKM